MRWLNIITGVLVLVGALSLGIVGLFNYSVVTFLFGEPVGRVVYILVGLSALWQIIRYRSVCACYWAPTTIHGPVTSH